VHRLAHAQHNLVQLFGIGQRVIVVESDDQNAKITIPCYKFTKVGTELISLGTFEIDEEYLSAFTKQLKSQKFKVSLARITKNNDEGLEYGDAIEC
jgi:hypothetical protein